MRMKRWNKGALFGLAIGLAGAAFGLSPIGADFEKELGLNWLFGIRGALPTPKDVAVVAINENTAKKMKLSPLPRNWPRSIHGRLVDNLVQRGASVIIFDLAFNNPKQPEEDSAFARSVAAAKRVVLIEKLTGKRQPILGSDGRPKGWAWVEQVIPPIRPLAEAATGLGPFPLPKVQVSIYQYWAFKQSAGGAATMPTIALQLHALNSYGRWRDLLRRAGARGIDDFPDRADALKRPGGMRKAMRSWRQAFENDPALGAKVLSLLERDKDVGPPGRDRRMIRALARLYGGRDNRYLNFYGPPGTVTNIPYDQVLAAKPLEVYREALDLENKIVFVGFSDLYDPGQPDRFVTPFSRAGVDLSGVEIMATALANLLEGRELRPSGPVTTALVLLVFGVVVGFITYMLRAPLAVPLAVMLAAGWYAAAQYSFNTADLWLPVATPVLPQLLLALMGGLLGQYLLERRQKMQFSDAIGRYLPENVVRELTQGGVDPDSLNKDVYGTCLATDMAGFTTLSETMAPKDLAVFMNDYFDTLAQPLKRHGVDVTEFHADTIMCAWTAPERILEARSRAMAAALDVIGAIEDFNARHGPLDLYPRIGLEDGRFYLGHAGGGGRMSYSILGDCANTAARLESLNKHLGTHILASDSVAEDVDGVLKRRLGDFRLVGKAEPIGIVELMSAEGTATEAQRRLCERFAESLEVFGAADWTRASGLFEALLREDPEDGPARFYLAQCRSYLGGAMPPRNPAIIEMAAK